MSSQRNFFSLLFDLSFDEFITPKIIRVVYVIAIIGAGIGALGILLSTTGFRSGPSFFGVVMSVLIFFGYVIGSRIALEGIVALFRIAQNTSIMARYAHRNGVDRERDGL